MKKMRIMLVVAMFALVSAVSAQTSLGVKGGVNMSNFYGDDLDDQNVKILTSSLRHPKIFIKEFGDFLMPCHQHCLSVYILVQR